MRCSIGVESPRPRLIIPCWRSSPIPSSNADSSNPTPTSEFPKASTPAPGDSRTRAISCRGTVPPASRATSAFSAAKSNTRPASARRTRPLETAVGAFPFNRPSKVDVNEFRTLPRENKNQESQSTPPDCPECPVSKRNRKPGRRLVYFSTQILDRSLTPLERRDARFRVIQGKASGRKKSPYARPCRRKPKPDSLPQTSAPRIQSAPSAAAPRASDECAATPA